MKIKKAFLVTALYCVMLFLVYYIHVTYFKVNVVFYDTILDAIVALLLTAIAVYRLRNFSILSGLEKGQLIVICALLGYSFAISVPTVIDRSLSFYILEKIQQRGGGIRKDKFEYVFTQEYMREHRLIDVRLTEQLESGTISIQNDCVKLTNKGELIASFGRYFRTHFLPKERLLMGEYSDDLTDPFRGSKAVPEGYKCN